MLTHRRKKVSSQKLFFLESRQKVRKTVFVGLGRFMGGRKSDIFRPGAPQQRKTVVHVRFVSVSNNFSTTVEKMGAFCILLLSHRIVA